MQVLLWAFRMLRRAEQSLRESHQRLRRLVDSNIVGIVTANEHRILDANDIFLDMLGFTRDDLERGRLDWVKQTPAEFLQYDEIGGEQLRHRGSCAPYQKDYFRKDGTRIPIPIGSAVLTDEPELSWICFVLVLTAEKALEAELKDANRRLSESNDELQRFSFVVAHDLKSPLRTISTHTSLLARRTQDKLTPEDCELLNRIQSSVTRMNSLISEVLEYARFARDPEPLQQRDSEAALNWRS